MLSISLLFSTLISLATSTPSFVTIGNTNIYLCTNDIVRITHTPNGGDAPAKRISLIANLSNFPATNYTTNESATTVTISTSSLKTVVDKATELVTIYDLHSNEILLQETKTTFTPTTDMNTSTYIIEQSWISPTNEALYGGGEFQNGLINFKNAPIQLVQFNTEAIIPFFLSSLGHGILWDNYAWSYLNPVQESSKLTFTPTLTTMKDHEITDGDAIGLRGCDASDWHQLWTYNTTGDLTITLSEATTFGSTSKIVLDMNDEKGAVHCWERNEKFNYNQQWNYNATHQMFHSLTKSDLCLKAAVEDVTNNISVVQCDISDPLQKWEVDTSTGLIAMTPSIISRSRRVQAQQFTTLVSNTGEYEGALCLSGNPNEIPKASVTFVPTDDGDHYFYIDACPNQFGCGMGKTLKLWMEGIDVPIIDWQQLTNLPDSITGRAMNLQQGKTYTIYYDWSNFDTMPPVYYRQPNESNETTLKSNLGNLIDYYFTAGHGSMDVAIQGYRTITGQAPLYADWAYGFWQCKEHYKTQAGLLTAAHGFRNRSIPVDNIVQDWHYWGNLGWGPQWDPAFYPNPAAMVKELKDINMQLMVSVWSKYDKKTTFFKDMTKKDQMLNGTVYYDAWNSKARENFYSYSKTAHFDIGVAALWLDATEPEGFPNVDHNTALGSGNALMNSYSLMTTRAIQNGLKRDYKTTMGARPFALTRSSFAGQQETGAALWSGDISGKWDSLRRQVSASLNYAMSGMPYWSEDMGGFFRPSDQYVNSDYHDLLVRWFQFGAFTPLYRVHGGGSNTEIWNYGSQVEALLNNTNTLRYRFLPYTYSGFAKCALDGYTMQRAMVMDYKTMTNVADQFMWGDSILVAPIVTEIDNSAKSRSVALPTVVGGWINFWTGESMSSMNSNGENGEQSVTVVTVTAPIDESPLLIKSGTVLILGPMKQYVAEKLNDPIEIRIYTGANGTFELYEDDGKSRDYLETKKYTLIKFDWKDTLKQLVIDDRVGSYDGMLKRRTFRIVRVGVGRGVGLLPEVKPEKIVTYVGEKMVVQL